MWNQWTTFLYVLLITGSSCKPSLNTNHMIMDIPIRRDGGEKTKEPTVDWGDTTVGKNGRLETKLILSLDYLSKGTSGSGRLPRCLKPLDNNFGPLGKVICRSNPRYAVIIFPSHVHQECYTDPRREVILPQETIIIENCKNVSIFGYDFEPELKLDLEPRTN